MLDRVKQKNNKTGWGTLVSIISHLILLLLIFIGLPELSLPAKEEVVHVEFIELATEEVLPFPEAQPETEENLSEPRQQFESALQEESEIADPAILEPPIHENNENNTAQSVEQAAINDISGAIPLPDTKPDAEPNTAHIISPEQAEPEVTLITAAQIYSKDAFSNPHIKQALGRLSVDERISQICSIEALEQIRRNKPNAFPDLLASVGAVIDGTSFIVKNGAYRSGGLWYEIAIDCLVNDDAMAVIKFSYHLGKAIPKSEWANRKLPTD